jgi:hypothetical protein
MGKGKGKKAYNTPGFNGCGYFHGHLLSGLSLHRFYHPVRVVIIAGKQPGQDPIF